MDLFDAYVVRVIQGQPGAATYNVTEISSPSHYLAILHMSILTATGSSLAFANATSVVTTSAGTGTVVSVGSSDVSSATVNYGTTATARTSVSNFRIQIAQTTVPNQSLFLAAPFVIPPTRLFCVQNYTANEAWELQVVWAEGAILPGRGLQFAGVKG